MIEYGKTEFMAPCPSWGWQFLKAGIILLHSAAIFWQQKTRICLLPFLRARQPLVFLFCLPPSLPASFPSLLLVNVGNKTQGLVPVGEVLYCWTLSPIFVFFSHNSELPQTDPVVMDNFELPIRVPAEPKCQDHKHVSPCPVYVVLGREFRTSCMLSFYQLSSTLNPPLFYCCYFHFLYFGVYVFEMLILRQGFSEEQP